MTQFRNRRPAYLVQAQLFLLANLLALGCANSGPLLVEPGGLCSVNTECGSGVCDPNVNRCTATCATDADCAELAEIVGLVRLGRCGAAGLCVQGCSNEGRSYDGRNICIDGFRVPCSTVDESYCGVCDDMCSGQRCVEGTGCAPLSDVGGACTSDSDCRTNNCSLFAGVCRVPLETACDSTNCDLCISDSGWTYCSRECGPRTPDCPGSRCVGRTDINYFFCRPECGSGCPGTCQITTDGDTRYCAEPRGVDWTHGEPTRAELEPCRYDSMCGLGSCFSAPSCDSRDYQCSGSRGFCSAVCASEAECGEGGHCVDVCPPGSSECGPRCLPRCEGGCASIADAECREVLGVGGETVSVCDPRNGERGRCRNDGDCASGECSGENRCIATGGSVNGQSCSEASDCASGNCQSNRCRGTALRGDECTGTYDCSAGTCIGGVCD